MLMLIIHNINSENKVGGDNQRGFSEVLPSRLFTETIRWVTIRTRDRRKTDKQRTGRQVERVYMGWLRRSQTGITQALKNHTWDKNGVVASIFQTHYWRHCRYRRCIHTSGVISHGEVDVHA